MKNSIVLDFKIDMFNIKTDDIKILVTYKDSRKSEDIIELSYLVIKDKKVYFIQNNFDKVKDELLNEDTKTLVNRTMSVEVLLQKVNNDSIVCEDIYQIISTDNCKDSVRLIDNEVSEKLYTAFMDDFTRKYSTLVTLDKDNKVIKRSKPVLEIYYCTVRDRDFVEV